MNAKRMKAAEGVVLAALVGPDPSAAGIAAALEAACLLQSPESAVELARLRSLMGAQPLDLTEEQRDALSDAGNRALNDHYHEDLCFCREWPESCATRNYFPGMWDTAAFDIGLGAVLGLWESMRADAAAARVAELEAERHSTNEALDDAVREVAALRTRVAELETATKTARTEAIADAGDYLDEVGEKNAVHLLYTTDVPVAREMQSAFRLANEHIRGGCAHCRPSMRLPELCPEGQRLSLAACQSTTPTAGSAL